MFEIDDQELEFLEDFFDEKIQSDDVLDFNGLHGLLTAAAIQTDQLDQQALWDRIFDDFKPDLDSKTEKQLKTALKHLFKHICNELYSEDQVELPYADDETRENWCCGFMEWVFAFEQFWFESEEDVSSMLVPIEVGSGLFEDEEELKDIYSNEKTLNNVLSQIPEVLIDLYLHFQSPE